MASISNENKKRKQPIPRIEDDEVLGPFPLIILIHKKYFVSDANREKITKNLVRWLMGNTISFDGDDIQSAIDFLFERDHKYFLLLLSGNINVGSFGPIFVPMVFFSQAPDVVNPSEFQERRKQTVELANERLSSKPSYHHTDMAKTLKWTNIGDVPVPRDYYSAGTLQGDVAERKVFQALKDYYEKTQDACLVLHSHSFLYEQNFTEKDFIILNLTKGYIMVIEVKASSNGFAKAKEQLRDSKKRVQAVFDSISKMSNLWQYVGLCYIDSGNCKSNNNFVINGIEQLDLQTIESRISQSQTNVWLPADHIEEFVSVAKVLLFEAQGHHHAPLSTTKQVDKIVEELHLASAPENIFFWTPEQLSIVNAMETKFMFLMSFYGCGKTVLLIERAEHLLRNNEDSSSIHFYIDNVKASGLEQALKLRFANAKNIQIKSVHGLFPNGSNFNLAKDGVKTTDHLIIDEALMRGSEAFLGQLQKFQTQVSSMWIALGKITMHEVNFSPFEFRKRLEDFNFTCPTLSHCLRNGQKIIEYAATIEDKRFGLDCFIEQTKINGNSSINEGIVQIAQCIYPNENKALKEAWNVFQENNLTCSAIMLVKNNDNDIKEREKWFSENGMSSLYFLESSAALSFAGGLEFKTMLTTYPVCLKCAREEKSTAMITRCQAFLVVAGFVRIDCELCRLFPFQNYKNISWNEDCMSWEIDQGFTIDQLEEKSRNLIERTTKLRQRIKPEDLTEIINERTLMKQAKRWFKRGVTYVAQSLPSFK